MHRTDHLLHRLARPTPGRHLTVGRFIYDSSLTVLLKDDTLAYLQAVIGAKLRLQQSFQLSWGDPAKAGGSRSSIWVTPGVSMQFRYRTARAPTLNRVRVDELFTQANSAGGLVLQLDA